LLVCQCGFYRLNGVLLVVAQLKISKSFILECLLRRCRLRFKAMSNLDKGYEIIAMARQVGKFPHITKPGAGLLSQLLNERTGITGIDKRNLVMAFLVVCQAMVLPWICRRVAWRGYV